MERVRKQGNWGHFSWGSKDSCYIFRPRSMRHRWDSHHQPSPFQIAIASLALLRAGRGYMFAKKFVWVFCKIFRKTQRNFLAPLYCHHHFSSSWCHSQQPHQKLDFTFFQNNFTDTARTCASGLTSLICAESTSLPPSQTSNANKNTQKTLWLFCSWILSGFASGYELHW